MIGKTISHYRILEKLGEGGMGVVYKAHDTKLNRDVALKFLPQSLSTHEPERARFLQEAQAAAALNHPHICAIYSIGEEGEQPYIEMEFVHGVTLRRKIEDGGLSEGPLPGRIEDGIEYAIQIAEALQEAHCHGIVHRDIKADNIMVNSKNQVKVMDFGLAKLKGSLRLTKSSSTIGTLAYMAPEQIEGGEVDARSDIFSFGIVLFEMLTGHLPFRGEHEAAIMYSIVNEAPAPLQHYLPGAPSELLHILDRALEKDREDRYQTVQDMLIDLRRLKKDSTRVTRHLSSGAVTYEPPPATVAAEGKKSNRKVIWIGISAFMVLIAALLLLVLLRKPDVRLNPNRTSVALTLPFKLISSPVLSPDGNMMVFAAPVKDEWNIYMMNVAGSTPRRVTVDGAFLIDGGDISPDLSQIAYQAMSDPSTSRIKIVAMEGGQSRTLADTGMAPTWTPDGKRVTYVRKGRSVGSFAPSASGKFEIWSIRPDGGDKRQELVDTTDRPGNLSYSWSPDGRPIAWQRNFPEGYSELMMRELATGREEQLTHDRKNIDNVIWARNGQIFFISNKSGQANLWMISAAGGEAMQVTHGTTPIISASISANSKRILFYERESIQQIWTSSFNGTGAHQLTFDEVRTDWCAFSPDGRSIAAVIHDMDEYRSGTSLIVMDRQGENRKVLLSNVSSASWSPDSKWLAYQDSGKVSVIEPANPGTPRLLCEGRVIRWMDSENLIIWREMKSYQYSLQKGLVGQLSVDSLRIIGWKDNRILYMDFRRGKEGYWMGTLPSLLRDPESPRKIVVRDSAYTWRVSDDLLFALFQKKSALWQGIWRVSFADGRIEQLGKVPASWMLLFDMTRDGKELLWTKGESRTKLSTIENPFE
jgi:serine/threonine protein kinase/Tol biopolymer transport system component